MPRAVAVEVADLRAEIAYRDLRVQDVARESGMRKSRLSKILHGAIGEQIIREALPSLWRAVSRLSRRDA